MKFWILEDENLKYLNLGLIFAATTITLVFAGIIFLNRKADRKAFPYYLMITGMNLCLTIAYFMETLLKGMSGEIEYWTIKTACALEFILPYAMAIVFTHYLFCRIEDTGDWLNYRWFYQLTYAIFLTGSIIFCSNGAFFYIDEFGIYHRGPLYMLSQVIGVGIIVLDIILIVRNKHLFNKNEAYVFIAYLLSPLLAIVIQSFLMGVDFVLIAMTISILLIFVYNERSRNNQIDVREKEIADMRIKLVLSQMSPHFLYNALGSISQLCKKNPQRASEMTDLFAEFLRKNMSDIDKEQLIPFEQELRHIQNYVAIEQMRFGDIIRVEYDIQERDFMILPLVLQPIVENAIRHGIRKREDGGTILVSTKYIQGVFVIAIADDGVGFDTAMLGKDENFHLGLDSIRRRLELIPHASINISSTIGKGTTVTLLIPDTGDMQLTQNE